MDLPFERGQEDYGFVHNFHIPQASPEDEPPHPDLQEVVEFHRSLREEYIRTGFGDRYHPLWGRYLPEERWSMTQFSLPLITNPLYGMASRVWQFQDGHGLHRRFCTVRLCVRANGAPAKPCIIFRGDEDYIAQSEYDLYSKDVEVIYCIPLFNFETMYFEL